ncbi:hypothetical protein CMI39_01825 [Candidatus Pacearchaeota archaeon]|jgi:hypothetical protein|nr:hypothetical protein [Candidatus Pacearchaeota archaeon]|tara:strand:+ start:8031 stop:8891 length:861 start_codon:yes stop_codon:yes gene_type:complete
MIKKLLYLIIIFLITPNITAVIISEIMYAPTFGENYNEWIEIYNDGPDVDLSNWSLCGKNILEGYVDHNEAEALKNEEGLILTEGDYAVLTDGGSGTEVYSNFEVSGLALHVDSASLCGRLSNTGKEISIDNNQGSLIDSVTYNSEWGAQDNSNSLQFDGTWCEALPTPGKANSCSIPEIREEIKDTSEIVESSNDTTEEIISNEIGENIVEVLEENTEKELTNLAIEENNELSVIKLNPKDIKTENDKEDLSIEGYAMYGFVFFCILLTFLFILKKNKFNKNEFD